MDLKQRFLAKVEVDPKSGCWTWVGAYRNEYGAFKISGRVEYAHRAAWLIYQGDIPDGKKLLHGCDNTQCVNPDHLSLGTQLENIKDGISKGRIKPFRPTRTEPLTTQELAALKRDYHGGLSARAVCRKYNVARASLVRLLVTPD